MVEKEKLALERKKLSIERAKLRFEQEKFAHSRWWQEDSLVHNRLVWLLQSQVILFAAYGLLLKEHAETLRVPKVRPVSTGKGSTLDINSAGLLLSKIEEVIPVVGVAICVAIFLAIYAAWTAQKKLAIRYAEEGIDLGVSLSTNRGGQVPGYALPLIFVLAWWAISSTPCTTFFYFVAFSLAAWLYFWHWHRLERPSVTRTISTET